MSASFRKQEVLTMKAFKVVSRMALSAGCLSLIALGATTARAQATDSDLEAVKKQIAELRAGLAPASDVTLLKQEIATLKQQMADQEAAQAAKEMEDLKAADAELEKPSLKIYGFLDAGLSKAFLEKGNPVAAAYPFRKWTFIPGNMNLYLDGKPSPYFRALLETRYSFYPHGYVPSSGSTVERTDTRQLDTFSTSGYNKVIWGGIIVERAQMDWTPKQEFNLRVGYFLTPYGIWNVDHGTPTLISLLLPQFQVEEAIPQRQTGLQMFGTHSLAPIELGYNAYISNGRAPYITRTAPGMGYGGRLFLRFLGEVSGSFGTSGFYSSFADDKLGFNVVPQFSITSEPVSRGSEWAWGADVSIDWKGLRIRSEGLVRHVMYDRGLHAPTSEFSKNTRPSHYENYLYGLAAYRIGKYFEPYLYLEIKYGGPQYSSAEVAQVSSGGLNIYFTAHTMLKVQFVNLDFYNRTAAPDPDSQDFKYFISRFITVF